METRYLLVAMVLVFTGIFVAGGFIILPAFTTGAGAPLEFSDLECHIDADQTYFRVRVKNNGDNVIEAINVEYLEGPQSLQLTGVDGIPIPAGTQRLIQFEAKGLVADGRYSIRIITLDTSARATFTCPNV